MSLQIVKRTGKVVAFDEEKIRYAMQKALRATETKVDDLKLTQLVEDVVDEIRARFVDFSPNVENVQDIVEKHLMRAELYETAKAYILYRAKRKEEREEKHEQEVQKARTGKLMVTKRNGEREQFDLRRIIQHLERVRNDLGSQISIDLISRQVMRSVYEGMTTQDLQKVLVMSAVPFIEQEPAYQYFAARLFLQGAYKEVTGVSVTKETFEEVYRSSFVEGIRAGLKAGLLDERMRGFDLQRLSEALVLEIDELFQYMGISTLYERYFMRLDEGKRLELPQSFWMRVAMGLSLLEEHKTDRALEFYEVLSTMRFVSSTPTLFNAGMRHSQLSSCYLTTVEDDLTHIFKCIGDNAQMSKWSGGLANDWTNIRATGALIKATQAGSQGVVPFLKIANDVTAAIARTGKRRGGTCAYLETWHLDIEDFLDLRKNTGDERRRTHDLNTANWIPDLFMKRVADNELWTLFSPSEVPELHHLYGRAFEKKYLEYEEKARRGELKQYKEISAVKLWKRMITALFETGHPWMTFKDPCNVRSPQDHTGVIHSSNLCTEFTLNTSREETAVCNLGSINLSKHVSGGKIDRELLEKTVVTGVRMLDNVIDLNFYPTEEGKRSNMTHRPVGMGIMGFQDALFKMDISFDSVGAVDFSDESMELVAYYAFLGSSQLAKEKGRYPSYAGSKWDRGIFPQDTFSLLEEERGMPVLVKKRERLDWSLVREHVREHGMRNSNVLAIAPTATISTIAGCYPCIEPVYKNLYVKANISGEFTVVNEYLVEDLKKEGLWNKELLDQLKLHDGSLQMIVGIPEKLKAKYKEAFEIDPKHCLEITAVRGKWIDQSQSHNVFYAGLSGNDLSEIYQHAWRLGLKTTYYLRTLGATQIEKATLATTAFTQSRRTSEKGAEQEKVAVSPVVESAPPVKQEPKVCSILDPDCEACQ